MTDPFQAQLPEQQPAENTVYPWATQRVWVKQTTEPLAYHRLWHGVDRYKWWKPLVATLIGSSMYFTLTTLVSFLLVIVLFAWLATTFSSEELMSFTVEQSEVQSFVEGLMRHPLGLFALLGSVALMMPFCLLAYRFFGKGVASRLWSVACRIRWDILGISSLITVAVWLVVQLPATLFFGGGGLIDIAHLQRENMGMLLASLLVILIITPFQAAAEEVVFRGALLQMFGAWIKSPVIPVILSSLLFGALHIQYNAVGILAVTILGVTAAVVTIRTGGLEAAIALHVINNYFALILTQLNPSLAGEQPGFINLVFQAISCLLFLAGVEFFWMRGKAQGKQWFATRIDSAEKEMQLVTTTA